MRQAILILEGLLVILMCEACKKPRAEVISRALNSTNAFFLSDVQEPIILTQAEVEKIKGIVERFNQRSNVRPEKEIFTSEYGRFILGESQFRWLGKMLYIHDSKTETYYIVEDDALGIMSMKYFKELGTPPYKKLSQDQWKEVLSVLEKQ
jgi:hypothetical protein